jgi:hypothetical protein
MTVSGQLYHTDEFGVTRVLTNEQAREYGISADETSDTTSYAPKRSFLQTLNPISPVSPNGFSLACNVLLKMLSCLSSPAVVWAILASSISLGEHDCPWSKEIEKADSNQTGSGIAMSLTYGTVLTEGYNWPQHSVGLVNVSPIPQCHLSAAHHR